MLHVSTQKLIIKLCELTAAGSIAWKENDDRRLLFETEGYLVEIEERPPHLRLLQSDGRELERADEAELAAQPWPDGNGTFATHLADMAARAHRVARGTDLAISRILSSLSAPPRKAPESEPSPAAPEFSSTASDAILASVTAEPAPPPAPHSMPDPVPQPVEADTAIERVLAVQPAAEPVVKPEPIAETQPEPEPEPVILEAETVAIVAEPDPGAAKIAEPTEEPFLEPEPEREPPPAERPASRPQSVFGATSSFSRKKDPTPAKITSTGLAFGFTPPAQAARGEPEQPPVPAPAPKPAPPMERQPEPVATGSDIYKPWI
jgi:hypothetical protein